MKENEVIFFRVEKQLYNTLVLFYQLVQLSQHICVLVWILSTGKKKLSGGIFWGNRAEKTD